MIHQYKAKGFNIVLDIYSGSVHLVDDVTYDIIENYKNTDREELKTTIKNKFDLNDDEVNAAFDEVDELIASRASTGLMTYFFIASSSAGATLP